MRFVVSVGPESEEGIEDRRRDESGSQSYPLMCADDAPDRCAQGGLIHKPADLSMCSEETLSYQGRVGKTLFSLNKNFAYFLINQGSRCVHTHLTSSASFNPHSYPQDLWIVRNWRPSGCPCCTGCCGTVQCVTCKECVEQPCGSRSCTDSARKGVFHAFVLALKPGGR